MMNDSFLILSDWIFNRLVEYLCKNNFELSWRLYQPDYDFDVSLQVCEKVFVPFPEFSESFVKGIKT